MYIQEVIFQNPSNGAAPFAEGTLFADYVETKIIETSDHHFNLNHLLKAFEVYNAHSSPGKNDELVENKVDANNLQVVLYKHQPKIEPSTTISPTNDFATAGDDAVLVDISTPEDTCHAKSRFFGWGR